MPDLSYNLAVIGDWPSGKAPVFGTGIRGFESLIPSHEIAPLQDGVFSWLGVFYHITEPDIWIKPRGVKSEVLLLPTVSFYYNI